VAETFGLATAFRITELTGEKRELFLAGRALPYRPFSLSGSQRTDFIWYPGNPHATVQVLGAEEKPTTINGQWKDRFLKESQTVGGAETFTAVAEIDGEQVASADDLVHKVDDFRRKGQLVEVRWGTQRRRGIITEFNVKYDRQEDIEWDITFGWISQGDTPSAAVLSSQQDLGRIKSAWDKALDSLTAALNSATQAIGDLEDKINGAVKKITDRINEVTDAVASVAQVVNNAEQMTVRLNSIYEGIKDSCTDLVDTLTSVPPLDLFDLGPNDLVGGEPTFSASLLAESWTENMLTATRAARRQAVENQADITSLTGSNLLAVYTARSGDDLRQVATDFYGVPGGWRNLMLFNGLTQSELNAGQVVLVPTLGSRV